MARTVIAVFESVYTAKKAVWELLDLGFPRDRIDLIADQAQDTLRGLAKPEKARSEIVVDELRAGTNIGAGIGGSLGITGGLLIGLGTLHIPALLASLASGSQAVALFAFAVAGLSVVAGGLFGSLAGGLVGLGIPEEEIRQYAKNVQKGNVSVMIVADWDAVDGTLEVLSHHDPLEIKQKSIEWQRTKQRDKKMAERARQSKLTEHDRPR